MIVQCELCATKFKLDDSKVKDEGVRVRCSKCRHIFVVTKERTDTPEDADFDSFLDGLVTGKQDAAETSEPDTSVQMDGAETTPELSSSGSVYAEKGDQNEFVEQPVAAPVDAVFQEFDFLSEEPRQPDEQVTAPFDDYFSQTAHDDAGQLNGSTDFSFETTPSVASSFSEPDDSAFPEDFVSDTSSPFFEESEKDETVAQTGDNIWTVPEQSTPFSISEPETDPETTATSSGDQEISWDLGTVTPSVAVDLRDAAPRTASQPEWQLPESPVAGVPVEDSFAGVADAVEPPPVTATDRKRPVSRLLVAFSVISLLVVATIGGVVLYAIDKGPSFLDESGIGQLVKWAGLEHEEVGGISIRNTSSQFIMNKNAGELFVIRGNVVNTYSKPKGSIQLKASLYDAKGAVLARKNLFCGNAMTDEQLVDLQVAEIESSMGNQFGDSLCNIGLPPGKAIPFVAVFAKVPREAKDFGLEIVGETAAEKGK